MISIGSRRIYLALGRGVRKAAEFGAALIAACTFLERAIDGYRLSTELFVMA